MRDHVLGACLLVFIGVLSGTVVEGRSERWKKHMCSEPGYNLQEAQFQKETYWLCLKIVHIGSTTLATQNSAILLDPDAEESESMLHGLPLDITMANGYPLGHIGSAEGYIGDDHQFYGVLHIDNRTLHADPYGTDNPKRKYGAFESMPASSVDFREMESESFQRKRRQFTHFAQDAPYGLHFPYAIEEHKRVPGIARARVCELLLLADKEFFDKDANSSLKHVVRRMVHAVAQADIIFRNSDFNEDGIPDNIGFTVKYILVLTSDDTNARVFGDMLKNREIDGKQYLMRFARVRRLSEVCLGVAFSGHAFHNRTLGLSFTSLGGGMGGAAGGLCDRRAYGRSFNTLALAHATSDDKDRVPERIAALTLAHEMGHSFGAHHDDNFPNPECRGFLMGSQSSSADTSRHFEFSICSKRLIASTLHSMSYCLVEEDRPYCGNGIVEKGEMCDCGMPSSCNHMDPCCTPRAGGALIYDEGSLHVEGCSVSPAALCHPSQGLCCNARCEYADHSASGIDCGTLGQQCTCITKECRCGLGGRCLPDGTCHASECALLGLKECQCHKKGAGGKVSEARMCGICCQLESTHGDKTFGPGMCVGAEIAAKILMDNGYQIPQEWPDDKYHGPNVSLRVCSEVAGIGEECLTPVLRAWRAGEVCVSLGVVGFCSLTGVCKPSYVTPRSNVYPTIMNMKLKNMGLKESISTYTGAASVKLLIFCVIFNIKYF